MRYLTKNLQISIFTILFTLFSCSPKIGHSPKTFEGLPVVDLCDLPKYQNQEVYLKCTYSGVDEYWSLGSLKSNRCSNEMKVELDFRDDYDSIPAKTKKALNTVYNSYWNSYLKIEAKGVYETGDKDGYGHLGTNKSRFVVSKVVKIEVVR